MRVSDRQKSTPVGLSRFLLTHRQHGGFETQRDSSAVTVICGGCDASFSYLKTPEPETPADVDEALARITGGQSDPEPAPAPANGNGDGPERRAAPEPPVSPTERLHERNPFRWTGRPPRAVTARRLAPPGPHAPRRRRNLPLAERVGIPVREQLSRALAWAGPRRRTIALTALAIAGAYVFISLTLGDDASSSPSSSPPAEPVSEEVAPTAQSTTPPAVPDEGPMAEGARPLQTFEAGGPDVGDQTVPAGNFAVAMPPDWTRETNPDGSTVFVPDDGGGEVLVIAQPRGTVSYGQMTDEAAAHIAGRVEPGTVVARPAWKWVGNLLSVAIASEPDGHSEIAYIGVAGDTRYLVIRSIQPSASALVRLQADGIVTSLTAQ
jgi:hypothetical protein